ncbi:MAG: DUF1329 domain-containing protein [Myxococcota bacterium]|nr:DUF1329 domain-containing protein [Myxococcota bacterium]
MRALRGAFVRLPRARGLHHRLRVFPRCSLGIVIFSLLALPPGAVDSTADVEPGEVITSTTREKLRGLVPDEVYAFAIEGFEDLSMEIVTSRSYPPHPKYVEATRAYACQASVDEQGNLVGYTAGQPFPFSEWAQEATNHACDLSLDDPQLGIKLAWNVNYRWQGGGLNLPHWGFSYMRKRGKEVWRIAEGEYRRTYFSHRADLLPETHQLEPDTEVEWAEFFDVKAPFDLRGTMFLIFRYVTGKEDDTWAYIPALRRVRRIAATQKSDSLLGTEYALEDFYAFSGYVQDHRWQFQGETVLLATMSSSRECFPSNFGRKEALRVEGMTRLGKREEWFGCRFDPYGALPFVDETWEKRTVFQLDDVPRQEGHPYSRKKLWYDKETMAPMGAVIYDRAGKVYKLLGHIGRWSEDSEHPSNRGRFVLNGVAFMVVNVQTGNSNVVQFFNANAHAFGTKESLKYYDASRLKRGR